MKKLLTILSIGAFIATSSYGVNISINGTTDENNPSYLGNYTFTSSDSLLWKGIGSGDDTTPPVDAYLYVNDGESYTATHIFVSGTNGDNANLNLIFGDKSTLTLTHPNSLSFNEKYSIGMNLYTAKDATASLVVGGFDFTGENSLSKITANGAKRDVFFGEGLTITNNGNFKVEGSAEGGTMTIASKLSVAGDMSLVGANVSIADTAEITVAKKVYLGGNVDINGSLTGNEFNTSTGGGTITVNGTLNCNTWFSGGEDRPTSFVVNDGGKISINNKFGIHSGSTLTAKSGSTVNVGELAIGTNDNTVGGGSLVVEEGATLVSTGGITLFEGTSTTINGNLTVNKGVLLLEKDDNTDIAIADPTITIGSKAVLNVNNLRSRTTKIVFTSGSKTIVDASSYQPDGRGAVVLAGSGHLVEKGASLEIKGYDSKPVAAIYGSMTIDGTLKVSGGTYFAVTASSFTMNSSDITFTNTHLALGNNSDLASGVVYVKKDVDLSGSAVLVNKLNAKNNPNVINVSKDVTFNIASLGFYQQDANNVLQITLNSGSKLILEDLIFTGKVGSFEYGTLDDQDTIVINNFAENAIAIKNYNSVIDDAVLNRIEVEGIDQLFWTKGENGYHWLSAIAPTVPEPAEWAMILGALALGFAIYRKRK